MNLVRAVLPIATIAILAATSVVLAVLLVIVSSGRPLTSLEGTLLQIVILGTGVSASYLFSQRATRASAEQLVKPHARSAFRRVKSLYSGLFLIKGLIGQHKETNAKTASQVVEIVEAVVDLQVNTVADALEDWRDIVPEEVANLEKQLGQHVGDELEDLRQ